jgi:hypothetical protein
MDWGDFRALEYFAIIYDIAIDEEQYNPKWCHLRPPTGYRLYDGRQEDGADPKKPWATHRYFLFPGSESQGDLPDVSILGSFDSSKLPLQGLKLPEKLRNGQLTFPALRCESADPISRLWRKLLLAKYVRAKLQEDGSTPALDALNKLGLALLRAMPLAECQGGSAKLNDFQTRSFILKILFLNEAAACYLGYQSISLSDDCLNLIKSVRWEGETPYELVAFYNKAQGHLHIHGYYSALGEFGKVGKETSNKQNNYFKPENSDNSHLRWPVQKRLFDAYVGYPSVLQYAETLLNLQRSWEAGKRLRTPEPATRYQSARREILNERIKNDREPNALPAVWPADPNETDNLALQRLAVDSERALHYCQFSIEAVQTDKPSDPTHAIEALLLEFRRATEKLRSRMQRATKNRSEIDAACLSWAGGLSVCKELLSLVHAVGNYHEQVLKGVTDYFDLRTDEGFFRDVAVRLCTDDKYRDYAVELRKTLIENLYGIHDLRNEVKLEGISNGFPVLFGQIATCLKALLRKLIRKPPRFASKIELRGWREQRTLLTDGLLPDKGPESSARHKELRAFIGYGFVHPTEDDVSLDAAQRRAEQKVWKKCKTYHCVVSGKPTKCGGRALVRNPSFIHAASGSKTLHHLDLLVDMNWDTIKERLRTKRKHDAGWHFVVLQRWNSFTPAMRASEGGGYFLFHAGDKSRNLPGPIDVGVVIDPGYGFVKNFVSEGFGVCDITAIVITHDHPDHLADVASLVALLFELRKNRGDVARRNSKVEMLLSRGAFERLNPLIESEREVFRDTVVLEPGPRTKYYDVGSTDQKKGRLRLRACHALHSDSSHLPPSREGFDSVGIIGEIRDDSGLVRRVGIPSDTKWDAEISREFTEEFPCDLICLHLGSIIPEKFPLISYFDEKQTSLRVLHGKQHLYLPGVVWYLEAIRKKRKNQTPTMVILSEFGEELAGGVRIDIARRLQAYTDERMKGKVVVLPGDVGLRVDPTGQSIRCSCCHLEHPWTTRFHCETSGSSEQIFYVCPRCLHNLTRRERAESFANHHPSLPGTKS